MMSGPECYPRPMVAVPTVYPIERADSPGERRVLLGGVPWSTYIANSSSEPGKRAREVHKRRATSGIDAQRGRELACFGGQLDVLAPA